MRNPIKPLRKGRRHGSTPHENVNMEAKATKVFQATRGKIRSLFRRSDLSIRLRLIACFVLIVLLMIAADAVAVWQYWQIEGPAQRVSKTDQTSLAVVRVHLDVDTFRDSMAALASSHDTRQFSGEAASIRQTFLQHIDDAEQMLRATPEIEQNASISTALESMRVTLLSQLDTAVELATAGEWNAVRDRLEIQIPALIEFSSLLVERVDQQALQQRSQAIEDAQKARQRLFIEVPIAALLTLLSAAVLGWYVTGTVTGPLSVLTAGAEALARGDFQHKVQLRGNDELALVGNAFNYAAVQLQKLYDDLRRSEQELRDVINTVPANVWRALPDGVVDLVNQRLQQLTGLAPDDALGWSWKAVIHPDDRPRYVALRRATLENDQPLETEVRVRRADGEYRWLYVREAPLRDEKGSIVKWYGTGIDIEDRKRAEEERDRLRQLEADLTYINRVSTMGELAGSLAHEIRQPITAAAVNAAACVRWLRRDAPDFSEASKSALRIVSDVRRAGDIIEQVRSLYKRDTGQREPVDVNEIIREMIVLLRDAANRNSIFIRTELDAGLPKIPGDRVQLQQVLMNLMLNAIEAMKGASGDLTVTSQGADNGQILVAVSDSGCGLPIEGSDRLFEAFFTTKPQGTGMGLSISRRIIESHGGRLWASANTGPGATFQFTLPRKPELQTARK
jgi:PAS domain S-box-containing protein